MPGAEAQTNSPHSAAIQPTQLLPSLFKHLEEEQRITVFHVGPALQETIDFFSAYRCKLHFLDLFSELPIITEEESSASLRSSFEELLDIPEDTQFDICLFWDIFNFLDRDAVHAFLAALRPHINHATRAHAFGLHNLGSERMNHLYGVRELESLSIRHRNTPLPGYAPYSQQKLKDLLYCFKFERSVLLPDSRLELLLRAKA
ncbi:MAG: hypothetical protein ACI9JM_000381 [Halioglobus sp.]|jgi:hypothetical protein